LPSTWFWKLRCLLLKFKKPLHFVTKEIKKPHNCFNHFITMSLQPILKNYKTEKLHLFDYF
jgi:hypothetical protein